MIYSVILQSLMNLY